jgi:hypothetical protein
MNTLKERSLASLPYTHPLRRLYELKRPDETISMWIERSGIRPEEIEEGLDSGEEGDIGARRFSEIIHNCGVKEDKIWEWLLLGSDAPGPGVLASL